MGRRGWRRGDDDALLLSSVPALGEEAEWDDGPRLPAMVGVASRLLAQSDASGTLEAPGAGGAAPGRLSGKAGAEVSPAAGAVPPPAASRASVISQGI